MINENTENSKRKKSDGNEPIGQKRNSDGQLQRKVARKVTAAGNGTDEARKINPDHNSEPTVLNPDDNPGSHTFMSMSKVTKNSTHSIEQEFQKVDDEFRKVADSILSRNVSKTTTFEIPEYPIEEIEQKTLLERKLSLESIQVDIVTKFNQVSGMEKVSVQNPFQPHHKM